MGSLKFAGVIKAIKSDVSDKSSCIITVQPDAEYMVSHKLGGNTIKCAVFHPMAKWESGYVFQYEETVSFRMNKLARMVPNIGLHCELTLAEKKEESLFDVEFLDAPVALKIMSVISIGFI